MAPPATWYVSGDTLRLGNLALNPHWLRGGDVKRAPALSPCPSGIMSRFLPIVIRRQSSGKLPKEVTDGHPNCQTGHSSKFSCHVYGLHQPPVLTLSIAKVDSGYGDTVGSALS